MTTDAEAAVSEALRDLAFWLYRQLENEYDWLTSDAAVDEALLINEYTFPEAGLRAGCPVIVKTVLNRFFVRILSCQTHSPGQRIPTTTTTAPGGATLHRDALFWHPSGAGGQPTVLFG